MKGRKIFADQGWPSGKPFLRAFLSSPEVTLQTLKILVSNPGKHLKNQLADILTEMIHNNSIAKKFFWKTYVTQHRTWCAIRLTSSFKKVELHDPEILLTELGDQCWYGPISTEELEATYYLRTFHFLDCPEKTKEEFAVGEQLKSEYQKLRWTVVLKITPQAMCLSWDGFSRTTPDQEDDMESSQFPFWKHIPSIWEEICEKFNCPLTEINL